MLEIVKTLGERRFTGGKWRTLVIARCLHCGKESEMLRQNVVKHNKRSRIHCQHCTEDRYHRMTGTRIWRIWMGMRNRVYGTGGTRDLKNYHGRGIRMCEGWKDFENFYKDMSEGYSDDLTIERINVNGHYCKENCRWVSMFEQQSNKRNNRVVVYQGEQMHLAELCRRSGFSKMMLTMRLNRGMSGDEAVEDCKNSNYGKDQKPYNVKRRQNRMSTT